MKDQAMTTNPRRLLIIVAALAALLIAGGATAIAGRRDHPPKGTASVRTVVETYGPLPDDACGGACDASPSADPEPVDVSPTSGPWSPCDPDATDGGSSCDDDFTIDSCDAAYIASLDGRGVLLDALIENKTMVDANRLKDCPRFLPAWKDASAGFGEGSQEVGVDVKPGTYETTAHISGGRVTECYWERSGKNGRTIANDFVTAAKRVRVTIRKSDQYFTSERCGDWVRV